MVDSAAMLSPDDPRWKTLKGGYRMPLDPRPLIHRLQNESDTESVWKELWDELHHQGDVDEASYVAVPLIVDAIEKRAGADWNPFAIVAIIELERGQGRNPEVPAWLSDEYFTAIQRLAAVAVRELPSTRDPDSVRAMLSAIALAKGLRTQAKFLVDYTEDELKEIEEKAFG